MTVKSTQTRMNTGFLPVCMVLDTGSAIRTSPKLPRESSQRISRSAPNGLRNRELNFKRADWIIQFALLFFEIQHF